MGQNLGVTSDIFDWRENKQTRCIAWNMFLSLFIFFLYQELNFILSSACFCHIWCHRILDSLIDSTVKGGWIPFQHETSFWDSHSSPFYIIFSFDKLESESTKVAMENGIFNSRFLSAVSFSREQLLCFSSHYHNIPVVSQLIGFSRPLAIANLVICLLDSLCVPNNIILLFVFLANGITLCLKLLKCLLYKLIDTNSWGNPLGVSKGNV